MATTLLAIVLVLLASHALPDLARARDTGWLRSLMAQAGDGARALLVPLAVLVVVALVQAALGGRGYGFPGFAFALVVLYLCWGPRDLDRDIEAVLKAPDGERRRAAAQALAPDGGVSPLPFTPAAVVEASVWSALQRHAGVLFWFVVLGPFGAVGYRLVQLLARNDRFRDLVGAQREALERTALVLDWAPAHLFALSIALVSDFDAVVRAWREYHASHGNGYFTLDLGFLGVIAKAGVDADVVAGDGGEADVADPVAELADARVVLRRVLMVWLAVLAVLAIGGLSA
ncbi:regulatory signaling modulator protein AmpE [Dokdonella sp. MW10]|uniref:regulatory signaling modulator protein AmpE n=1 Tax=Dokdonella sp. MW10 TaxID=2992926 RepID=UPI003F81B399